MSLDFVVPNLCCEAGTNFYTVGRVVRCVKCGRERVVGRMLYPPGADVVGAYFTTSSELAWRSKPLLDYLL